MTQKEENPFKYSDSNKRYHTYDYYLKHRFGGKVARISLDAGFTCPNLDGSVGHGGCIYCLSGSSGAQCEGSLFEQYQAGVRVVKNKWNCNMFIPYLQAHTNTYADIDTLRKVYNEVISYDGAVMLAIATRADCLGEEVIELLSEISDKVPLTVELGLQSVNDKTADTIGRGHNFDTFLKGYNALRSIGDNLLIGVHLINGLPGETEGDMLLSAKTVSHLKPDLVKLHLLHVLKNTALCEMYERGDYVPLSKEEYVKTVVNQLEYFSPETVIARITGDGTSDTLVAPDWSRKKTTVANDVDKLQYKLGTYQGKLWNQ